MQNTTVTASFVDPQTIQLRFELGNVQNTQQGAVPDGYTYNPDSDGWVWDDGWIGRVQLNGEGFMGLDRYLASDIDDLFDAPDGDGVRSAAIDDEAEWSVTVNGNAATVTGISRKANISDTAVVGWGQYEFASVHNVFVTLDAPLTKDADITLAFDDPDFAPISVTYDPASTISEAIHTNYAGYGTDDVAKTAYLSSWNGWNVDAAAADGGTTIAQDYAALPFDVVNAVTGQTVLTGTTTLGTPATTATDDARNFALTDVWEMDFSDLTTAGDYYIVVDGVGRSNTFTISDDVWTDAFQTAFKGFYHQRSGIELTEEFTDWTHPRSLHPDDGLVTVYASTFAISDSNEGYDTEKPDQFGPLVEGATEEVLPDAWGGWHDAGDWDRRTQHIEAARKLIEISELNPEWAEDTDGNIPESGNGIPDVLDEAIWGLSVFARMQTDDGGIRGGIEGDDYRGYGAASWTEEHILYAYAPDVWSSWEFAAAAAKLSRALVPYDTAEAASWLTRAEDAFAWAEANRPDALDITQSTSQNLAAVELYAATGDTGYHDIYLATTVHTTPNPDVPWNGYQYEASFTYGRLDAAMTDADVAANGLAALKQQADYLLDYGSDGPFGSIIDPAAPYGWGNTAQAPLNAADFMVAMHALTGEDAYLKAIIDDVQYTLGANPMNTAFVTGLPGARTPDEILSADADAMGSKIPDGITLYGDFNIYDYGQDGAYDVMWNEIFPNAYQSPVHESFQAFWNFVPSAEYTVQQGITDLTYVTAYLAGLQAGLPPDPDQGWQRFDPFTPLDSPNTIRGSASDDTLDGTAEADLIIGGRGNDSLDGGAEGDMLFGRMGADTIFGKDGDDFLRGDKGADDLFGGWGDDIVMGNKGRDMLAGGRGADTFVFRAGDGRDTVRDYQQGKDNIALDAALWSGEVAPQSVATQFGDITGSTITLDFGNGDVLTLNGVGAMDLATLGLDFVLL